MNCNYCGATISEGKTCQDWYSQLAFYTLNHANPTYFIHQLIVDAYGAQHLTDHSKPIAAAFTLIGLYLFCEKHYTGKQVQNAHVWLANRPSQYKQWPIFKRPIQKATINAEDVLKVSEGPNRDEMIKTWAKAVWLSWSAVRPQVINFLSEVNFKEFKP